MQLRWSGMSLADVASQMVVADEMACVSDGERRERKLLAAATLPTNVVSGMLQVN